MLIIRPRMVYPTVAPMFAFVDGAVCSMVVVVVIEAVVDVVVVIEAVVDVVVVIEAIVDVDVVVSPADVQSLLQRFSLQ